MKRLGVAPRVGRVGLPEDAPDNVVNVHVGTYWKKLDEDKNMAPGNWTHSWHFDDPIFARDLLFTIQGNIDRNKIPTRSTENGKLILEG